VLVDVVGIQQRGPAECSEQVLRKALDERLGPISELPNENPLVVGITGLGNAGLATFREIEELSFIKNLLFHSEHLKGSYKDFLRADGSVEEKDKMTDELFVIEKELNNSKEQVESLQKVRESAELYGVKLLCGIEITHVPPRQIARLAREAKAAGADIVIVHGETPVEPVAPGTNNAACACRDVDVLAHPGIISRRIPVLQQKTTSLWRSPRAAGTTGPTDSWCRLHGRQAAGLSLTRMHMRPVTCLTNAQGSLSQSGAVFQIMSAGTYYL
jgi:hypothetical protein